MAGFRLSRGKIVTALLFIGLIILVRYAMSDMKLDIDVLREGLMNMPGVVMQNIHFEREISGDIWRVKIPMLEQIVNASSDRNPLNGAVLLRSADVHRKMQSGGEWYFFGAEGVYSNDVKAVEVRGMLGTIEDNGRVWNIESPRLLWADGAGEFIFPNGFTIYDHEFSLETSRASMDESGVVLIEGGGILQWTKPLPTEAYDIEDMEEPEW